jgi:hypothetical protein
MNRNTVIGIIIILIVIIIGAILYSQSGTAPENQNLNPVPNNNTGTSSDSSNQAQAENNLMVADQKPGNTVTIPASVLSQGGYIVIHENNNGAPGKVIGVSAYLNPGENNNVSIKLSRASKNNEQLFAMLHGDNGNKIFDESDDMPIKKDDIPVLMKFNIDKDTPAFDQTNPLNP